MKKIILDDSKGMSPLYSQIAYHLEQDIIKGKYPMGSKLPSQKELSEQFEVSRITIIKAMELLRLNGIISTRQGKGSVVIKEGDSRIYQSKGFSARYSLLNNKVYTKVISVSVEANEDEVSKNLSLMPGSEIIHIHRVRYLEDKPISEEHSYLCYTPKSYSVFSDLKDNQSIYKLLQDKLGITLAYAEEKMWAELPSLETQKLLEIEGNHPIMKVHRSTYENQDTPPVEFCKNFYNNETYGYNGIVSIKLQS